jgi:hypothetical protein
MVEIEEILAIIAILLASGTILYYRYKVVGYLWVCFCFKRTHNFKTEIEQLNTPLKVQGYMNRYFKYVKDRVPADYWKKAEVTWKDQKGDCEDWAIFAAKCLTENDNPSNPKYKVEIFCMYKEDKGHATCLIHDIPQNKWLTIGTFGYRVYSFPDDATEEDRFFKVAERFYKDWHTYTRYDHNQNFIESVTKT